MKIVCRRGEKREGRKYMKRKDPVTSFFYENYISIIR